MKKKYSFIVTVALLITTITGRSQINNARAETVKVYGNCGMCKSTIEKAASRKKISKADWNEETKIASITYDSKKTNLDDILKNIALAGYDNQRFLAPDAAYNKLPVCCKYDRVKKNALVTPPVKDTMHGAHNQASHQHGDMNITAQEKNQLTAVFDNYFPLKDALVKDDGNTASAKAKDLLAAINAVKMGNLTMEVHIVWMKVLNNLQEDAEYIQNKKDIARQRDHFMRLSKNMYELIKVSKPKEAVYYQFCPMANDGKGANWLSRESGIKNPYYGSQMLTCGNTVETIKQ